MKIRDLRRALFYIENQEMTVEELRDALFNVQDQDAELSISGLIEAAKNTITSKTEQVQEQ